MLERVLEHLEQMRHRVGIFVNPVQVSTIQSYLSGFANGCVIGGLNLSRQAYIAAAEARGWTCRASGIVWHMRKKHLTDAAIIDELIVVQADAFRRAAEARRVSCGGAADGRHQ